MPKRKRDDSQKTGGKLEEQLEEWEQELKRSLKQAKGFERQRLSKRIKDSPPDKVERLEREVVVLKSLDLGSVARAHLSSSLLKIKGVAESPKLPPTIRPVTKPNISPDEHTALHNVTSALCNRKQVKDVVEKAVMGVCMALRVPMPDKRKKLKIAREEQEDQPDDIHKKTGNGASPEDSSSHNVTPGIKDESDDKSWGGFSDNEQAKDHSRNAHSRAEDWSGPSEEEDSGEEDSDSDSDSDDEETYAQQPPKSKARKTGPANAANSMFLPSLMGGYIENSDSDASDIEDAPRKNRRGQRARQAIWEKKFGNKAKHKVKQSRDEGWDLQRGAVGSDDGRHPWKRGIKSPFERRQQQQRADEPEPKRQQREVQIGSKPPPRPINDGPLHPSWAAAQKKKAAEKQAAAAFQGKKIVFT